MRSITYNEIFSSGEKAQAYVDSILYHYPTQGYGTYLTITERQDGPRKIYVVRGSRSSSCD